MYVCIYIFQILELHTLLYTPPFAKLVIKSSSQPLDNNWEEFYGSTLLPCPNSFYRSHYAWAPRSQCSVITAMTKTSHVEHFGILLTSLQILSCTYSCRVRSVLYSYKWVQYLLSTLPLPKNRVFATPFVCLSLEEQLFIYLTVFMTMITSSSGTMKIFVLLINKVGETTYLRQNFWFNISKNLTLDIQLRHTIGMWIVGIHNNI